MQRYVMRIVLCLLFLVSVMYISADKADSNRSITYHFSERLLQIFYELCDLVENSHPANEMLCQRVALIRTKRESYELLLLMSDQAVSNVHYGAQFNYSPDNPEQKPIIIVEKNLLALYPRQKSLVFSLLIHEMQHAYNYFIDYKAFTSTYNNLLENYLYEMDAYHVEALLIRDVLIPHKLPLTDFGKLLVSSFKNDNLDYFSYVFKNLDMSLVYYLCDVTLDKQSAEKNIREFIRVGNQLIDSFEFPEQDNEWNRFITLIPMHTYCRFIQQYVYNVLVKKAWLVMAPEDFFLPEHSQELYDIVLKMQELLNPYNVLFITYGNKLMARFGESLLTDADVFEEVTNYESYVFADKILQYIHVIPNEVIERGDIITPNIHLGKELEQPTLLSDKHHHTIQEAISLYNAKRYEQAAKLMKKAAQDEPSNPFILYYYAGALYRYNRKKVSQFIQTSSNSWMHRPQPSIMCKLNRIVIFSVK
ncbi:MAG: hypothetical protein JW822_09910 [Spirochaetales bacterium]|nr:hypothetical protein [Spirochaetales bacterium]